ncbi:hypothetical protein GNI_157760 [Gregarina niphandrodes]|uniref:Uncharacterized protein n=1 Tax=Gregarina niphandrodes TaxID=110365 RepID=A0A023AZA1_GRENI|nr:hypothetical protein GNI_157760 [Gregarina niphandrodes]EZG43813.1 hypothetical protein GNI_157760 [Gregarina niphandrodes]|eukprot:XP_011132997.1 hypothetical protein GNI_157760 [Gregarina niphandrodes]
MDRQAVEKACDGINTKPKFKSAYYFSLQPLETLCDSSTGRCHANALYALDHGTIPKVLVGLKTFPDDLQVVSACIKILNMMCQSSSSDQVKQFVKEGAFSAILQWVEMDRGANAAAAAGPVSGGISGGVSGEEFAKIMPLALDCVDLVVKNDRLMARQALPSLLNRLQTTVTDTDGSSHRRQLNSTLIHSLCDCVNDLTAGYPEQDLDGAQYLIAFILKLSEAKNEREVRKLLPTVFGALQAYAAHSENIGNYILDLLEIRNRYQDEPSTKLHINPVLSRLCTREQASQTIETIKTTAGTKEDGKMLIQTAFCPDMAEIVHAKDAYQVLIKVLNQATEDIRKKNYSESNLLLVRGACLCLAYMCDNPEYIADVKNAGALKSTLQLITTADDYPDIIAATCTLLGSMLKDPEDSLKFIESGVLKRLLDKAAATSATGEGSSSLLSGISMVMTHISRHEDCCTALLNQNVCSQLSRAIGPNTFRSVVSQVLNFLINYSHNSPALDPELIKVVQAVYQYNLFSSHVVEQVVQLLINIADKFPECLGCQVDEQAGEPPARKMSDVPMAALYMDLIMTSLDNIQVNEPAFALCVTALNKLPDRRTLLEHSLSTTKTLLPKIVPRHHEALRILTRLAALSTLDDIDTAGLDLAAAIQALVKSGSQVDVDDKEALVMTLILLIKTSTASRSDAYNAIFGIALRVNDPLMLVFIVSLIKDLIAEEPSLDDSLLELLVTKTQELLSDQSDSREGSVAALNLVTFIAGLPRHKGDGQSKFGLEGLPGRREALSDTVAAGSGSRLLLEHKVQSDVMSIAKKLKMRADVQLAVFRALESMLRQATEEQVKATRTLGITEVIKSAEANHSRNTELRKQTFKVSMLVMQENYLEELVKQLIARMKQDFSKGMFDDLADDMDQLLVALQEPDGPRLCTRHKLISIIFNVIGGLGGSRSRDMAKLITPAFTRLVTAYAQTPIGGPVCQSFVASGDKAAKGAPAATPAEARSVAVELTKAIMKMIADDPHDIADVCLLLQVAGLTVGHNQYVAEHVMTMAPSLINWLEILEYNSTAMEAVVAWMSYIPLRVLVESEDFSTLLQRLRRIVAGEAEAPVGGRASMYSAGVSSTACYNALNILRYWTNDLELVTKLQQEGVEAACFTALSKFAHDTHVMNAGLQLLEMFANTNPMELPQEVTVQRARTISRAITSADSELTVTRAFNVLGKMLSICPDPKWFRGETSLIKSVRTVQVKVTAQEDIEDAMAVVLSVMGGEEMALMLMSQVIDTIKQHKSRTAGGPWLDDIGPQMSDVSLYLQGTLESPQKTFLGISDTFSHIAKLFQVFPKHSELRQGTFRSALAALNCAILLKDQPKIASIAEKAILEYIAPEVMNTLNTRFDLDALKLMAKMCECPTTSEWALDKLKTEGILTQCYRTMSGKGSSSSDKLKALNFMGALSSSTEGFHMLQRAFKIVYGSNTDFWQHQLAFAKTLPPEVLPAFLAYIYHFPRQVSGVSKQALADASSLLKDLGSKAAVSLVYGMSILAHACKLEKETGGTINAGAVAELGEGLDKLGQLSALRSLSQQEVNESLYPLAVFLRDTSFVVELDELNNRGFDMLGELLGEADMTTSLWKSILPLMSAAANQSNFVADRVVRNICPVMFEQSRFFKGQKSAVREDGLRLLKQVSMLLPEIPGYSVFAETIGDNSAMGASAAGASAVQKVRGACLRERNAGTAMNHSACAVVKDSLEPVVAKTLEAAGQKPMNPGDAMMGDYTAAVECIGMLRGETIDVSPSLKTCLTNQTNPAVVSKLIATIAMLRTNSPQAVEKLRGDPALRNPMLQLLNGIPNVPSAERVDRLKVIEFYTSGCKEDVTSWLPIDKLAVSMFPQTEDGIERRYYLKALKTSRGEPTPEIVDILMVGLQDERSREESKELCANFLSRDAEAGSRKLESLLDQNQVWAGLVKDLSIVGPLLSTSAVLRKHAIDQALGEWLGQLPRSASAIATLCELEPSLAARVKEIKPVTEVSAQFSTGGGEMVDGGLAKLISLLLKDDTDPATLAACDAILDVGFTQVGKGLGDSKLVEACCNYAVARPSDLRKDCLVVAMGLSKWEKQLPRIFDAILRLPDTGELKKRALRKVADVPECHHIILREVAKADSGLKLDMTTAKAMLSSQRSTGVNDAEVLTGLVQWLRQLLGYWDGEIATELIRTLVGLKDFSEGGPAAIDAVLSLLYDALAAAAKAKTVPKDDNWGDEHVPSEGFLPLTYAIKRPNEPRAWEALGLSSFTCGLFISTLTKLVDQRIQATSGMTRASTTTSGSVTNAGVATMLNLLAYLACEKPLGCEQSWTTNNLFENLRTCTGLVGDVYPIAVICANVAAITSDLDQIKNQPDLWSALQQKANKHKQYVQDTIRYMTSSSSTQLTFLRKLASFNWFS